MKLGNDMVRLVFGESHLMQRTSGRGGEGRGHSPDEGRWDGAWD